MKKRLSCHKFRAFLRAENKQKLSEIWISTVRDFINVIFGREQSIFMNLFGGCYLEKLRLVGMCVFLDRNIPIYSKFFDSRK